MLRRHRDVRLELPYPPPSGLLELDQPCDPRVDGSIEIRGSDRAQLATRRGCREEDTVRVLRAFFSKPLTIRAVSLDTLIAGGGMGWPPC